MVQQDRRLGFEVRGNERNGGAAVPGEISVGVHWGARLSLNGPSLPGASDVLLGQEGAAPEPHGLGPWQGLAPQGKREVCPSRAGRAGDRHAC